jgi:lipopolysaccharide export system protein LptA
VISGPRTGHWQAGFFLLLSGSSVLAQKGEDITFKADSVSFDLQLGQSVYQRLTLSDSHISIDAAEGTTRSLEGGGGVWELRGGLRVTVDGAVLTANSGTFRYASGRLTQGELLGSPATLDAATGSEPRPFHVTAGRIAYDALQRILRVSEGAVLSSEEVELEKCSWVYDLGARTMQGSSDTDSPCKGRVKPKGSGP